MNTCLECLPCLGKNAVNAAKRSTADPAVRQRIVAESLRLLAENDFRMPPAFTARKILDIALKHTGVEDIYLEEKKRSNALAEKLLAGLSEVPGYAPEDFGSRLRLAVAGNILDFGIFADLDIARAMEAVKAAFSKPLDHAAVDRIHERMDSARSILYVLDNCGEAVFDRVFMEPYREKITLGVRGRAAFNDVLAGDLAECGLRGFGRGAVAADPLGIPGVILSECGREFRTVFDGADLVIAKGQGNFETMNGYPKPIAFLFLAKCPVITRELGCELNSIQIRTHNF